MDEQFLRETNNQAPGVQPTAGPWHCEVVGAAAKAGDPLSVKIPDISHEMKRGPVMWNPISANNGMYVPGGGEVGVVEFDNAGVPWLRWIPGAASVLITGSPTPTAFTANTLVKTKLPTNNWTKVKLNATNDPGNRFNAAESWYVVPADGYYQVNGRVRLTEAKAALAGIAVNGARLAFGEYNSSVTALTISVVTTIVFCKAGDHIELHAYHESAGERETELEEVNTGLSVVRVDTGLPGPQGPVGPASSNLIMTNVNGAGVTINAEPGKFYSTNKAKELVLPFAAPSGSRVGLLKWEGEPSYITVKPAGGQVILSHGGGYGSIKIWVDQPTTFTTDGGNWWIDGQGGDIGLGTAARACHSTAGNMPTGWAKIKMELAYGIGDPGGLWDFTNGYYVVPVFGTYQIHGNVGLATGGAVGEVIAAIWVNGEEILRGVRMVAAVGGAVTNSHVSGIYNLNVGQKVELACYNNTGAERALEISGVENALSIVRVA